MRSPTAVERGWQIVGVLAAQDDAVLIRNRIPIDVPVVDEADVDGLEPGALVAVEVVAEGRAYRAMADPIALSAALELGPDEIRSTSLNSAVSSRIPRRSPSPAAPDRPTARRRRRLRRLQRRRPRGAVLARAGPRACCGWRHRAASHASGCARCRPRQQGIAVDDAFFTDLASIDNGAWLRRGVADAQGTVVALLAADEVADAAATLARADRPARADADHRTGGRGVGRAHHTGHAAGHRWYAISAAAQSI